MELKRLISHFTYRIERKPGGGFIAHPADPSLALLEAPSREELQKKIQENILAGLSAQFPGLKPLEGQDLQFAFHIEHKPEGGFVIHSSDPNAEPIEVLTHNDLETHFAERIVGFVGKRLTPELSQALASQGNSGDIRVFVNRNTGITVNAGSHTFSLGVPRGLTAPTASSESKAMTPIASANAKPMDGSSGGMISNTPIVPEAASSAKVFRILLLALAAAAVLYFFLHYR